MLDILLGPIDPTRAHDVDLAHAWHGRFMVVAWGVLVPVGVLAARFFKVLPRQRFPEVVDNRAWWRTHLGAQIAALLMMVVGMWLVLAAPARLESVTWFAWLHRGLGWAVLWLGIMQAASGAFRGTKGGPTDPRGSVRGDHYDMTPRRLAFEAMHKASGYAALVLSMGAVLTGLWQANGPVWIWILLTLWWAFVAVLFVLFQRRGMVIDTYVAIWGPDPSHPGNASRRRPGE
ncbi:MAG: cytochrome b561 domain-containing protein [Pseudomonadota bacterium]